MFGFNKKKSKVEQFIDSVGMDRATDHVANLISEKLPSKEIAYQFVLEEIEAASQGNDYAKRFVMESGLEPWEYQGAMSNSRPEVDGDGGPQQSLLGMSLQLRSKPELMLEFRTMVVDKIMNKFNLGKYGSA